MAYKWDGTKMVETTGKKRKPADASAEMAKRIDALEKELAEVKSENEALKAGKPVQ
jgi:uncharacterized protein YceH (UPF0502 family)